MSKWISCPSCGEPKEVPAYEGDGVYHNHICSSDTDTSVEETREGIDET